MKPDVQHTNLQLYRLLSDKQVLRLHADDVFLHADYVLRHNIISSIHESENVHKTSPIVLVLKQLSTGTNDLTFSYYRFVVTSENLILFRKSLGTKFLTYGTPFFTFLSLCVLLNQFLVLLQTIKLWLKFCCFINVWITDNFTHIFFLSSIRLAEFFFISLRQTNLNPSVFRIQCPRWSVIWLVNQLEVVRNIKNFMLARNQPSVKKLGKDFEFWIYWIKLRYTYVTHVA